MRCRPAGCLRGSLRTARPAPRAALAAATAGAIALAAAAAPSLQSVGSLGPAPRDAEGRFVNLAGDIERAGPSVTIPFFFRRILGSFRDRPGAPGRVPNDGAWLRENATHSEPSVTWIGHATLLVQMGHLSFLTDPIWSETASPVSFAGPRRFVPPGVAIADLPPIDFVVISHNHYDHLDLATLEKLAARSAETRFYVPLGNGALLREAGIDAVVELDWGESARHGAVRITCLPTQHWSQRGVGDERAALWGSWAVTSERRRFYFAGDSGAFPGFEAIGEALGPFDLAAMPIGAYEPVAMMKPFHLDPEEAIAAGRAVRAERVVAMHFGTFDLSDEPLAEPPRRFRAAGRAAGFADEDVWVLDVGESRAF